MTIKVWTQGADSGLLGRHGQFGSAFGYTAGASPEQAVSLTMPVRLACGRDLWMADTGRSAVNRAAYVGA